MYLVVKSTSSQKINAPLSEPLKLNVKLFNSLFGTNFRFSDKIITFAIISLPFSSFWYLDIT